MTIRTVEGDLLDQQCDAIVNPWNRNIIPWWLLLPHGVSGAIKKRAGLAPFMEIGKHGPIPLGTAVATSAGGLPYKAIIHVTGIDGFWRASRRSIEDSVKNAIALAERMKLESIAFPIIGSGAGGYPPTEAEKIMREALEEVESNLEVTVVRYKSKQA